MEGEKAKNNSLTVVYLAPRSDDQVVRIGHI